MTVVEREDPISDPQGTPAWRVSARSQVLSALTATKSASTA